MKDALQTLLEDMRSVEYSLAHEINSSAEDALYYLNRMAGIITTFATEALEELKTKNLEDL